MIDDKVDNYYENHVRMFTLQYNSEHENMSPYMDTLF